MNRDLARPAWPHKAMHPRVPNFWQHSLQRHLSRRGNHRATKRFVEAPSEDANETGPDGGGKNNEKKAWYISCLLSRYLPSEMRRDYIVQLFDALAVRLLAATVH